MPSLNFLKKKRTREDKHDPSSSQPTSPVTPTTSRPFDAGQATSTPAHQRNESSNSHHLRQSIVNNKEPIASAGPGSPMNSQVMPAPQAQPPYGMQHTPSPGTMGGPHNLPSINNLIHSAQPEG